jgi:hypothetical protein
MLFVCSQQLLFSQSSFNLGLGVGHQFGLPGIRAGYNWKRFELSVNTGLFGGNKFPGYVSFNNFQKFNYCIGSGVSYRINKKQSIFPKGIYPVFPDLALNAYITYNCGYIISYSYSGNGLNLSYSPYLLHSISGNSEWCLNNKFKVRLGFGWALIPINRRYFPTISFGGIYTLKQ